MGQLGLGGGELGVDVTVCRERRRQLGPAEGVDHLAVLVGPAQPPLVGLAVDGDEVLGELAEESDRCGPAPDVGA